jgi:hypothetical protein
MLRYTIVADGSSDRALSPILDWLIEQHSDVPYEGQFADHLPPVSRGLKSRIAAAVALFPCNLLFVHRDAETVRRADREQEIVDNLPNGIPTFVPVIPVRMTEAWLLSDESAIRTAADNPNGTGKLAIPPSKRWEASTNPKAILRQALKSASGLPERRQKRFNPDSRRARVSQLTTDFSKLRTLSAFRRLEGDLVAAIGLLGFNR